MEIPRWVSLVVGVAVIYFGFYRLGLARRDPHADGQTRARGGLNGLPQRTHLLFAILYLLMGTFLVASGSGLLRMAVSLFQ